MLKSPLLALLLLLPLTAVAAPDQAGNRYDNRARGLRQNKPGDCRFLTPSEDHGGLRLAFGSPAYQQYLLARTVKPLIELARYSEPHRGPHFNSRLRLIPTGDVPVTTGRAMLESSIPSQLTIAEGAELSVPVREVMVAGRPAGHAVYYHRLRDIQNNAFAAIAEVWMRVDRGYWLTLDATYPKVEARGHVEQLVSSLGSCNAAAAKAAPCPCAIPCGARRLRPQRSCANLHRHSLDAVWQR